MRKILGYALLAAGALMMIAPQALMGLKELQWLARYAFPGQAILGIVLVSAAYWLIDFKVEEKKR